MTRARARARAHVALLPAPLPRARRYTFSRRERPHLVFGDARDPSRITHLSTGVQFGTHSPVYMPGEDACYTLLQPVG